MKVTKIIVMCILFAVCLIFGACKSSEQMPPPPIGYVTGISITYDGNDVSTLTLDKADAVKKVSATVSVVGEISTAYELVSSNASVATVTNDGNLTLVAEGETIISAISMADTTYVAYFVLNVTDLEASNDITVNGGVANKQSAAPGEWVKLTAALEPGYKLTSWAFMDANGEVVADIETNGNSFKMPDFAVTVIAQTSIVTYNISVIDGIYEGIAQYGQSIALTYLGSASESKRFIGWVGALDNEAILTGNTFTMPARDLLIEPVYVDEFTVAFVDNLGTSSREVAVEGEEITLTFTGTAPVNHRFKGWAGVPGYDVYTAEILKMPAANIELSPVYERVYTISVTGGTANKTVAAEGETVTLMATVEDGQRLLGWRGINDELYTLNTFVMPAKDMTITAEFEQACSITVTGGSSSVSSALVGETVTLTASTPEGKRHIGWKGVLDGDAIYESNTFVMPNKSLTITAVFEDLAEGESKVDMNKSYDWGTSANIIPLDTEIGVESALRYPFPANSAVGKYLRIRGSDLVLTNTSYSVNYTVRNSGKYQVSLTISWEDYGEMIHSEEITLAAGETKTINVVYPKTQTDVNKPYIFITLTKAIGGAEGDISYIDIYAYKTELDLSSQGYYSVTVEGSVGSVSTASAQSGELVYLSAPTYDNKLLSGWTGINNDDSLFVGTCFTMPAKDLSIAPVYVDVNESSVGTEGANLTFGAAEILGQTYKVNGTNGSYSISANVLGNKLMNIEMSGVDFTSGPKKIVYTIKFDQVNVGKKIQVGILYGESQYITHDVVLTATDTEITITQILPEFSEITDTNPMMRIIIPSSNPWGSNVKFTISAVVYDITVSD